jgi:plasmid stabilization system protein ParE
MTAELIFVPEVENDLTEAYDWYEEQRRGLGEEFLNRIEASLQKIRRTPDAYPEVYKKYRRTLIRRFPYMIFYEHEKNEVIIYGIFHSARDPDKWKKRLA